jgi:hypothetical protein
MNYNTVTQLHIIIYTIRMSKVFKSFLLHSKKNILLTVDVSSRVRLSFMYNLSCEKTRSTSDCETGMQLKNL